MHLRPQANARKINQKKGDMNTYQNSNRGIVLST